MWRLFAILFVVGFLMLVVSPFVWGLNARVHEARLDVDTAAYSLRADVSSALTEGGLVCVIAGVIALIRLRNAKGRLGRARAILPAIPPFIFAAACLAKLIVVLPFVLAAYGTAPGYSTLSITLPRYNSFTELAQLAGVVVFLVLIWPSLALVYRHRHAPPL